MQIVGLSATVPNAGQFAQWLRAELFRADFRPVHLKEYVKCGREILVPVAQTAGSSHVPRIVSMLAQPNSGGAPVVDATCVRTLPPPLTGDDDHLHLLTLEAARDHSVLVFCATKVSIPPKINCNQMYICLK